MGSETDQPVDRGGAAWGRTEPAPSGFVAFWPHRDPPVASELARAVTAWTGDAERTVAAAVPAPEGEKWMMRLEVPGISAGIALWAEEATELGPQGDESIDRAVAACPWVVRMQVVLSPAEVVEEHFMAVSLLHALVPDAPAILDVVTSLLLPREHLLRDFTGPYAVPNEQLLSGAICVASRKPSDGSCLRTVGLERCGLPELELLGVPAGMEERASKLMEVAVGVVVEAGIPEPGETLPLGPSLEVMLRRASEVKLRFPQLPKDRSAAVLCEAGDGDSWPAKATEALLTEGAEVYASKAMRRRIAAAARRSFDAFATAFASLSRHPATKESAHEAFFVQGEAEERTLRWWRVEKLVGDGVEAMPMDDAPSSTASTQAGTVPARIGRDAIFDWRVTVDGGPFGPWDPDALLAAVDRIRAGGES